MAIKPEKLTFEGRNLTVYSANTLVIGSGAAGLNAALQLVRRGVRDVILATERWGAGTSFNAGSDKQTYYKLSLAGAVPDSPLLMAEDLFKGGSMHGDIALCEAQNSAEAFYHLTGLGVPFPHDRYGAYVGYKTDHDSRGRATSTGPLTSRAMCEHLGRAVQEAGVTVANGHQVIALLTRGEGSGQKAVCGALAIDLNRVDDPSFGFAVFNVKNIILATGGPGGIYKTSVYPESQIGSFGPALAAGARAQNLTESQFGLASIDFRWNVSGSYQQVIPRYVSTDASGKGEREFLNDVFPDLKTLFGAIFRKGYQWPFDADRIENYGSSLIDLAVYRETVQKGRRVFLDFTQNPSDAGGSRPFTLDLLDEEARAYLENSRATGPRPIDRLEAMNRPAIDLYRSHGIDLHRDRLEIAVCAQHLNGGLIGDIWWESNVRHLFPVGEVNGSHGVRRPGGAALNAGQVGGIRAALFIARRYNGPPPRTRDFLARIALPLKGTFEFAKRVLERQGPDTLIPEEAVGEIRERMSAFGASIRDPAKVEAAAARAWAQLEALPDRLRARSPKELPEAFRAADLCLTHAVVLEAIRLYLEAKGGSRGSFLVLDPGGKEPCPELGADWRFRPSDEGSSANNKLLEVWLEEKRSLGFRWTAPRPIPGKQGWFERVWNDFEADRVILKEEEYG